MLPPFVDAAWLAEHRDDVLLVEVGAEPTVPGAVLVDLDADLAAPAGPGTGRHPLPTPEDFAAAMSRAGLGDDDTVVAVDASGR